MIDAVRDMVIVEKHYKETFREGNIVIPETHGGRDNIMEYHGIVVSIGPECPFRDELKVGDKILFHRNEGLTITNSDGKEYKSLNPRAILCII